MAREQLDLLGKPIIEPFGKGLVRHSSLHSHIHAGKAYNAMVSNVAVAAGASIYMQLTIPEGVVVHFKNVETFTDGTNQTIAFIEKPTFTTGTTAVLLQNRKRDGKEIASMITAFSNPTGISGGTTLRSFKVGSGSVQIGSGGLPTDKEWLLYGAGTWIIKLTNDDATAAIMYIDVDFYEERYE